MNDAEIRIEGPGVIPGSVSVEDLIHLVDHYQIAIRRMAQQLLGKVPTTRGPATKRVQEECTLLVTGLSEGSTTIGLAVASQSGQQTIEPLLGVEAARALAEAVKEFGQTGAWPSHVTAAVRRPLLEMSRVVNGKIAQVMIASGSGPGRIEGHLDRRAKESLMHILRHEEPTWAQVTGQLLEIDWRDSTCEIHTVDGQIVRCGYGEDLADDVTAAARSRVAAGGMAERNAAGLVVRIDPLEEIVVLDSNDVLAGLAAESQTGAAASELQSHEIREDEELAGFLARVCAKPIASVSLVSGGWEDDRAADEILDDIIGARRSRRRSS